MPRNTNTGAVLENMVLPALRLAGYHYQKGVDIGLRLGGRSRHRIDVLGWEEGGNTYLISLKWQQSSGTAEQKVPFEVMCLADAVLQNNREFFAGSTLKALPPSCTDCRQQYSGDTTFPLRPYLVLGGGKWTLREFYTGSGLTEHMAYSNLVTILDLEHFVALCNKHGL